MPWAQTVLDKELARLTIGNRTCVLFLGPGEKSTTTRIQMSRSIHHIQQYALHFDDPASSGVAMCTAGIFSTGRNTWLHRTTKTHSDDSFFVQNNTCWHHCMGIVFTGRTRPLHPAPVSAILKPHARTCFRWPHHAGARSCINTNTTYQSTLSTPLCPTEVPMRCQNTTGCGQPWILHYLRRCVTKTAPYPVFYL